MRRPLPPPGFEAQMHDRAVARFLPRPITVPGRQPWSPKGAQTVEPKFSILQGARRGSIFPASIPSSSPSIRDFHFCAARTSRQADINPLLGGPNRVSTGAANDLEQPRALLFSAALVDCRMRIRPKVHQEPV